MSTNTKPAFRRALVRTAAVTGATALGGVAAISLTLGTAFGAARTATATITAGTLASGHSTPTSQNRPTARSFTFALVPPSAAVATCLPAAAGQVTITPNAVNEVMTV